MKIRKGDLQEQLRFSFPIILGLDVKGVIEEVGEEIECFKIGDKCIRKPENIGQGSYAEFITVKSDLVSYMPTNLSFEEAASIPLAGLTAWQSLVDYAKIKEHDRVLIHAELVELEVWQSKSQNHLELLLRQLPVVRMKSFKSL